MSENVDLTVTTKHQDQSGPGLRQLAAGLSGVATAAFSLYLQYDRLEKMQLNIDRAQKTYTQAQSTALTTQRAYNEVVAKYGENSAKAEEALLRMNAAQQNLAVTSTDLRIKQGELSQAQMQLALSAGPAMITMVTGLQGSLKGLLPHIRSVNLAMLTSPIGIIAIAVGALVGVLYLATDGFKNWKPVIDAVNQAIQWLLIPVKGLLTIIGYFVPEAQMAVEALENFKINLDSTEESSGAMAETLTTDTIPAVTQLTAETGEYITKSQQLNEVWSDAKDRLAIFNQAQRETVTVVRDLSRSWEDTTFAMGAYARAIQATKEAEAAMAGASTGGAPPPAGGGLAPAPVAATAFTVPPGTTWTRSLPGGGYAYGTGTPPEFGQGGLDRVVNRPTLFMGGEAGPERVTISPLNRGGGGVIILRLDGMETRRLLEGEEVMINAGRRSLVNQMNAL